MTNDYLDQLVFIYGHRVFSKYTHVTDDQNYFIGRPSIYGNPIPLEGERTDENRIKCILEYRNYLFTRIRTDPMFVAAIKKLAGKGVVCHCSNGTSNVEEGARYCHGHVLLSAVDYITQEGYEYVYPHQ